MDSPQPHPERQLARLRKGETLPKGTFILSSHDVIEHHWKRIVKWKPVSEVLPFRCGGILLGAATALSSIFIHSHYRKMFYLGTFQGRFFTIGCTMIVPTFFCSLLHRERISNKILSGDASCEICLQTQSGAMQAVLGTIWPSLVGFISCLIQAEKFATINSPARTPFHVFELFRKTAFKGSNFWLVFVVQLGVGAFLAKQEQTTFENVLLRDVHTNKEDLE